MEERNWVVNQIDKRYYKKVWRVMLTKVLKRHNTKDKDPVLNQYYVVHIYKSNILHYIF